MAGSPASPGRRCSPVPNPAGSAASALRRRRSHGAPGKTAFKTELFSIEQFCKGKIKNRFPCGLLKTPGLFTHLFSPPVVCVLGCKLRAPLSALACANRSLPAPAERKPVSDSPGAAIQAVGN